MSGTICRFLVVGLTTVAIDAVVYAAALQCGIAAAPAKGVGFVAGAVFAFHGNRAVTFRSDMSGFGSMAVFGALYLATLVANVGVNEFVRYGAGGIGAATEIAFFAATATSATLNFLGMKYIVFR